MNAAEQVAAVRAKLWDAGFRPVPVYSPDHPIKDAGKRPLGNDWVNLARRDPPDCLTRPPVPHALNTGVLCNGLRAIDIDMDDPAIAAQCRAAIVQAFGEAPIRMRRNSSRCLILYRAAEGEPGKCSLVGASHTTEHACKIEVLGKGQQFAAFGRHPSGAELEWFPDAPGDEPIDALPVVDEATLLKVLTDLAPLIGADPPGKPNSEERRSGEPQADPLRIAAALNAISNNGPADWEAWNRVGMAVWRATGGSDIGRDAWHAWSSRHPAYDRDETQQRWHHYFTSPPTEIGAGTLFHMAKAASDRPHDDGASIYSAHAEAKAHLDLFDPWAALQAPAFPFDAVPDALRAFIEDRATVIGADPCAMFWASVAACSAAMDGRIRLQMKKRDQWSVPAFLWVALVGAPSTKKTPILDAAWTPLQDLQNGDLQHWRQEHARWSALPKKERAEIPEPVCRRRLVSHDATIEAIQEILGRQDRGLGLLRDELAGFIGSLEKYSGPRGGAADRAFYLQAYNGGAYVADRIARGTTAINNHALAIVGGIQPDRLRQLGDITADGLWQRFLLFIVAPASIGCDTTDTAPMEDYAALIERLLRIPAATRIQLSDAAHAVREDVAKRLFDIEQSDALGPAFSAFCGKLHGVWGRLCLVLSQIDPAPVPFIVSERIAKMARDLIFRSVLPNAAKVYASMGGAGGNIDATRSIAGYVLTKQKTRVLASDLAHNVRACRGQPLEDVQRLVSPLVAGGWFMPEREFNANSWTVHPRVHQHFAARASQEAGRRATLRALIAGTSDHNGSYAE